MTGKYTVPDMLWIGIHDHFDLALYGGKPDCCLGYCHNCDWCGKNCYDEAEKWWAENVEDENE